MKTIVSLIFGCLLVVSGWSNVVAEEAPKSPLIQQGSVEVSTLANYMGTNILGLGAGVYKEGEGKIGTLGLSVGYFALTYAEIEGSFGIMRMWNGNSSSTYGSGMGKIVLNYVTRKSVTVPYVFGGGGLMYVGYGTSRSSESETEKLITFGGGIKLPLAIVRQLALRIEYSYMKVLIDEEEESYYYEGPEPIHNVGIGFSAFF